MLIIFRAIQTLYGPSLFRNLGLAATFTSVLVAANFWIPTQPLLYTQVIDNNTQRTQKKSQRVQLNIERTYYAQPGLIRNRLQALARNRPNLTDLYFLGFAGDGQQDVFMREVRSVTQLFDKRFDTEARSMMLINNQATLRTDPMANMHNLSSALRGIGAAMDTENDVLFLFLTSHGSRNATLSTAFGPFGLNDISANGLARALDKSGIKWRVIVVSACYSGSFINALKDDHTLIITASSPDRNSFGCSNEAEYTYFGRAYFDEALRSETSFIAAFETTRATVAKLERAENLAPSDPQIVIGRHIRGKLRELEERIQQNNRIRIR